MTSLFLLTITLLLASSATTACNTVLEVSVPQQGSTASTTAPVWNACANNSTTTPGAAYLVEGKESVMEVTVCSEEALLLYVWDDCGSVTSSCLAVGVVSDTNNNAPPTTTSSCRRVTWQSQGVGVDSYVWIESANDNNNDMEFSSANTTDFEITLTELQSPDNNVCTGAVELPIRTSSSSTTNSLSTTSGSTRNATLEVQNDDHFSLSCRIRYESAGVWYTVRGTGDILRASTCFEGTEFDTAVSVFPASDDESILCNQKGGLQRCAGGDQDNFECGFVDGSTFTWPSIQDKLYYILVHGNRPEDVGNFEISLVALETASNNNCETALGPLSLGSKQVGSTVRSTPDPHLAAVCAGSNFSPGVWFTVEGTGKALTVSTCAAETNFDTKLSVLTLPGEEEVCSQGTFDCVGGHDDDIECDDNIQASTYTWDSAEGQLYYILLHGALESSVGDFGLTVSEGEESSASTWTFSLMSYLLSALAVVWYL